MNLSLGILEFLWINSRIPRDCFASLAMTAGNFKFICDEILSSSPRMTENASRGMTQGLGILEFLVYKCKKHLVILDLPLGILDLSLRILEFLRINS